MAKIYRDLDEDAGLIWLVTKTVVRGRADVPDELIDEYDRIVAERERTDRESREAAEGAYREAIGAIRR